MTILGFKISRHRDDGATPSSVKADCEAVGAALGKHDLGDTVTAVQQLILRYYDDVRGQADASFVSAKRVAFFGFAVLIATILYVMFMDFMPHISDRFAQHTGVLGVGWIGLIGSSMAEFIAGVQFFLYGHATKQFGTFHICLERTHRYLLAYSMAEQIKTNKDGALEKIVCIMANAPMITRQDIDGDGQSGEIRRKNTFEEERAPASSGV